MSSVLSLCMVLLITSATKTTSVSAGHHHHSNDDLHAHILQQVSSTVSAADQAAAALGVIERTIPIDRAAQFTIEIDPALPPNTFHLQNFSHNGHDGVAIRASSGTAACKGFHHYLKYYCNCHLSWDGHQLDRLPVVWPAVDHRETSASPIVYYQNVCTWSYSFVWWKWLEWRRHIDWMALNGITLTLAPVQELVWSQVYADLGMTGAEIDRHFAGPAFMAWQRMGNMRGWGGPLSDQFKRESSALQQLVIAAQRELGMVVALPAFAGHVPVEFARLFPNSSFTAATRWNRFSDEQCCPLYIDPIDPLFQTIGQQYLRSIVNLYGTNHIYFSDPFNEMTPSQSSVDYIGHASQSIYEAMKEVDRDAVWLLQGWMFVNEGAFWTPDLAKAFLRAVPLGRMLVLDLQSETQPQYQRLQSYFGQPFVWCMLHNFGGTSGMHGSVEVLNTQIAEARKMPNSTMIGFGITMEGINQNYAVYEFALERGWDQLTVPADKWFDKYALTRYGRPSVHLQTALQHLRTSVYSYNGSIALHGQYIVCKRPGTKHSTNFWYNVTDIELALGHMIEGSSEDKHINDLQYFDLVDITRQYLQTRIDLLYPPLIEALKSKDRHQFQNFSDRITDALQSMELILSTDSRFMLGPAWLHMAERWAQSETERQLLVLNARNQITLWGPKGEIVDYAIKQWAGVIGDYCLPRWQLFFADALEAMERNKTINMTRFKRRVFKRVEKPFTMAYDDGVMEHEPVPVGDVFELAKGVLERWAGSQGV